MTTQKSEIAYEDTARKFMALWISSAGMKIQLEETRSSNPTSKVTVDDVFDDSIVREIEKAD